MDLVNFSNMKLSITTLALLLATVTPAVHSKDTSGADSALSPAGAALSKKENASPPDQKNRKLMHEQLYQMFADEDGPLGDVLSKQCFKSYLDIGLARYENFLLGSVFGMSAPGLPELPINQAKREGLMLSQSVDMLENLIIEGHQGLSAAAGVCRTYGGSPRYLDGYVKGAPPSNNRSLSGSTDTCEDNVWGYDHRIICAPKKGCTDQELVNTTVLIDSFILQFYLFGGGFLGGPEMDLNSSAEGDIPDMEEMLDCEQLDIVVLKNKKVAKAPKSTKSPKNRATRNLERQ
jgi:hypothetical protein